MQLPGGISSSQVVAEEGKYSLDVVQNNPGIEGSLRNEVENTEEQLSHLLLPYRGVMPKDADFNEYITPGWYGNRGTNQGQVNVPREADNGFLIVMGIGSKERQIWIGLYARTFRTRLFTKGAWNEWKSFVLS